MLGLVLSLRSPNKLSDTRFFLFARSFPGCSHLCVRNERQRIRILSHLSNECLKLVPICHTVHKVSSSSIISPVNIVSALPVIVDSIGVCKLCKLLYTVGLLSSVRTTCAVAFAH